jgi:hypothetical protein
MVLWGILRKAKLRFPLTTSGNDSLFSMIGVFILTIGADEKTIRVFVRNVRVAGKLIRVSSGDIGAARKIIRVFV